MATATRPQPKPAETKYVLWSKVEAEMVRHDGVMKTYRETSWHKVEDQPAPAPYADMSRVHLARQSAAERFDLHISYRMVPEGTEPK